MLTVKIYSFSYKKSSIPSDDSGNGGGFVFDCRHIYNPGRKDEYKDMTGKDKDVKEFLDNDVNMQKFLSNVKDIATDAVNNYISRNFSNIMFSFGCTGGQHRSVYSAENLAEFLRNKYGNTITVFIEHKEYPKLNKN